MKKNTKKTKSHKSKARYKWAMYRWEFMRRSEDYQEAWARYQKDDMTSEMKTKLAVSFGLTRMINPNKSFIDIYRHLQPKLEKEGYDLEKAFEKISFEYSNKDKDARLLSFLIGQEPNLLFVFPMKAVDIQEYMYFDEDNDAELAKSSTTNRLRSTLVINIEFSEVNSITNLRELIANEISERWNNYLLEVAEDNPTTTMKLQKLSIALRVGCLRDEKEMTFSKIGYELYGKDTDYDSRNAEKQVTYQYGVYKKLIKGDYRRISYP